MGARKSGRKLLLCPQWRQKMGAGRWVDLNHILKVELAVRVSGLGVGVTERG